MCHERKKQCSMVKKAEYIPYSQALAENRPSRKSENSTKLTIDPDYVPTYEPPTPAAPQRDPPSLRPPPQPRAPHAPQSTLPPPLTPRNYPPSSSSQSSPPQPLPPAPPLSSHNRSYPGASHAPAAAAPNPEATAVHSLRSRTIVSAASQPPPPPAASHHPPPSSRPIVEVPPLPQGIHAVDYHRQSSYPLQSVHSPTPPVQTPLSPSAYVPSYARQPSHQSTSIHEVTPPPQNVYSPPPQSDAYRSPSLSSQGHSASFTALQQNLSRTRRLGEEITAEANAIETATARLRRAMQNARRAQQEFANESSAHIAAANELDSEDGTLSSRGQLPWSAADLTDAAFATSTPHSSHPSTSQPPRQFAVPPPRHSFPQSTHRPPATTSRPSGPPPPSEGAGSSTGRLYYRTPFSPYRGPRPPRAHDGSAESGDDEDEEADSTE